VTAAAKQLGIAASTLLRWLNDGFVAGEQITPGAPWRIRLTDHLRGMLVDDAPTSWLALHHASRALGTSPPNRVAEGQARRTRSRPDPHRTPKRLTYQRFQPHRHSILIMTISGRSSVTMPPSSQRCLPR
jgi:hypothetical protein